MGKNLDIISSSAYSVVGQKVMVFYICFFFWFLKSNNYILISRLLLFLIEINCGAVVGSFPAGF